MKNLITILFLSLCLTASAQEKCVTVKVEKIENYRVKITKTNTCKNIITISTMLEKDWKARKKKRKTRKKKS
tara:strand:- start:251 stop:466 length:216 start_codon:yes stop_codon:yes gene_type:complete